MPATMAPPTGPLEELLGQSPAIAAVRDKLARLLARPGDGRRLPPVLIQGETGTGKGLLARAVHRGSSRAGGPFVDVNCAAIPETLLEAEMFGFERGAFTDARQAKRGLFQTAHQGTLFLDEVGLLPEALQAKLLKVIEERTVRRLGSTQSEPVDVWVVAATSVDLQAAVRDRSFREDLYHRLAVITVWLPPLRDRGEDVVLLAEHFLARACADYGVGTKTLAPDARAALMAYPWPGNIRELGNAMERVALLAEGTRVEVGALGLPAAPASSPGPAAPPAPGAGRPLLDAMDSVEREQVVEALRETGGNVSRAAARLGVSRNTLRYRMEKHGLRPDAAAPLAARRRPGLAPATPSPAMAGPPPAAVAPPAPPAPLPGPPPEVVHPVRWDRRRLTLLRAVLALPAEDVTGDVSRPIEIMVDKIRSFGGRVESLSPSGVTGAFGLEPAEDVPRRAAHAAMAVVRAAEGGWEGTGHLPVRLAVHLCQLLVGRIGGPGLIDEEAKQAALAALDQLVARTEPGTVSVSGAAAAFLERWFDLQPVGPAGTGRPGPDAMFRLGRRERSQFGPRLARLVGRQRELATLRGLLDGVLAGRGHVVGIVGEPGMGKSRLLYELRQGAAGERITYLEARCAEHESGIPYFPVAEILRQNCGITDTDRPPAIAAKLRDALETVGLEARESVPYLLHLLGIREGAEQLDAVSPETVKARRDDIVRRLTREGSRRRPILFAVEDLQWIDSASEELIASLVESLATAPILLVATYRPGYRPSWLDRAYATQIALGPLSADESLALVRSVLGVEEVPADVGQAILERAQGNPFILEELARTVGPRTGDGRPGRPGPVAAPAPIAVPDTVQEAILSRLDRLPDPARRLLRTASVLGREVPVRLLREVWRDPGELEPLLQELGRRDILHGGGSEEESVAVFRHTLTQEVVYGSLLEGERRRDHGGAGRALERLYAGRTDEVVERLAYHFGRSDERERAVDYAILAGEKAQRRWANAEALGHLDAALARLTGMPDTDANRRRRIEAVLKQAEVKFALGQHAEHIQALEHIRDQVMTVTDPRLRASWHYWCGFLHSLTSGPPGVAISHCQQAVAIAEAAGLDDIRAFAECCLAQAYGVAGQHRAAVTAARRALAHFEARQNVWWTCRTLGILGTVSNVLGDWKASREYSQRALARARAVSDLRLTVGGLWRTASAHVHSGDPATALQCCDEGLAASPAPYDRAMLTALRGYALVKAGQVAAGTAELEGATGWFRESGLLYVWTRVALWLAEGYLRQGDPGRARPLVEDALATGVGSGYRYVEGVAHRLLGECLGPREAAEAAGHFREARSVLEAVDAPYDLAKTWAAWGELSRATGDVPGARERLERARELFERLEAGDESAPVRSALAALDGTPGA